MRPCTPKARRHFRDERPVKQPPSVDCVIELSSSEGLFAEAASQIFEFSFCPAENQHAINCSITAGQTAPGGAGALSLPVLLRLARVIGSLKLNFDSKSYASRLDRPRWYEKVPEAGGREINKLRAKVEDCRIERIECLDLRCNPQTLSQLDQPRDT